MLVYSKWENQTTYGVAIEVNDAIEIGIPVFELVDNKFVPQKAHVNCMSFKETMENYKEYESSK
jgi:hypothetical protein